MNVKMTRLVEREIAFARRLWPIKLETSELGRLRSLVGSNHLSVIAGDVQLLDGKWYVTHSGLLRLARKNYCSGIHTETVSEFCDPAANRWVIKATVFKTPTSKGFVGYGDADPTNVSPLVRGAEMRVAETRAVNRALRKAYGIGLCSVEEIGTLPRPLSPAPGSKTPRLHPSPRMGISCATGCASSSARTNSTPGR